MKPIAQHIDEFRIVPRFVLFFYLYLVWDVYLWVKSLEVLSTQQGVFSGAIISLFVPLCGWYFSTGKQWSDITRTTDRKAET